MKTIEQRVHSLLRQTVGDLSCSLNLETDLEVLELALSLAEQGAGYGNGITAKKMIQTRVNAIKKLQAPMRGNKWIEAATRYGLQMHWQGFDRSGLSLMCMTVMAENGGHKLRKLFSTLNVEEALKLSIEIYASNGRLNCDDLVTDTWWQYGWDPEMMEDLRAQMRVAEAHVAQLGYRQTDWLGWSNWRKEQKR